MHVVLFFFCLFFSNLCFSNTFGNHVFAVCARWCVREWYSFLFQFYMLVFVNLCMYIFVVREGLMED